MVYNQQVPPTALISHPHNMSSWWTCTHKYILFHSFLSRAWVSPTLVKWHPRDLCIYLSMYRTSFRNECPRVLIHWTASILPCIIQFRKCHYVQIVETGLILHNLLEYASSLLLNTHDSIIMSLGTAAVHAARPEGFWSWGPWGEWELVDSSVMFRGSNSWEPLISV